MGDRPMVPPRPGRQDQWQRWADLIAEAEERAGWAEFVQAMRVHFDTFGRFTPEQAAALQRMIDRADGF